MELLPHSMNHSIAWQNMHEVRRTSLLFHWARGWDIVADWLKIPDRMLAILLQSMANFVVSKSVIWWLIIDRLSINFCSSSSILKSNSWMSRTGIQTPSMDLNIAACQWQASEVSICRKIANHSYITMKSMRNDSQNDDLANLRVKTRSPTTEGLTRAASIRRASQGLISILRRITASVIKDESRRIVRLYHLLCLEPFS